MGDCKFCEQRAGFMRSEHAECRIKKLSRLKASPALVSLLPLIRYRDCQASEGERTLTNNQRGFPSPIERRRASIWPTGSSSPAAQLVEKFTQVANAISCVGFRFFWTWRAAASDSCTGGGMPITPRQ